MLVVLISEIKLDVAFIFTYGWTYFISLHFFKKTAITFA